MNSWLCPVRLPSWRKIKETSIFGVGPSQKSKLLEVGKGDFLAIYLLRPVDGFIAICEVISDPYEGHDNVWGKGRYPHRVKIKTLSKFLRSTKNAIPLSSCLGHNVVEEGLTIEPYLHRVALAKISHRSFQCLKHQFE